MANSVNTPRCSKIAARLASTRSGKRVRTRTSLLLRPTIALRTWPTWGWTVCSFINRFRGRHAGAHRRVRFGGIEIRAPAPGTWCSPTMGGFMYVVSEMALRSNRPLQTRIKKRFGPIQTLPMLPTGFSGIAMMQRRSKLHPSGKFLYSSNRGHDSIIELSNRRQTGMLTQVADVPTGGKEPRHFAIDPTGNSYLQRTSCRIRLRSSRIDSASGKLTPTGETLSVPSPVCIRLFLSMQ